MKQMDEDVKRRAKIKSDMPTSALDMCHTEQCRVLPDRGEMLRRLPRGGIAAEIGAAFGDFTAEIIEKNRPAVLHLVDSWSSDRYKAGLKDIQLKFGDEINKGSLLIQQGLSTEILKELPDNLFDWVYIDTNHGFRVTWEELNICEKKVKNDGMIAGHDFCTGNTVTPVPYGVVEAVSKFCLDFGWRYEFLTLESHGHFSFALKRL